ncbi:MAG: acyl-CoA-binding protein, partial [Bacteroidota bacterium]
KRPGFTNPVGRAKYDAWAALEGTDATDAKQDYVDLVSSLQG